jgi:hypothetical protein
MSNETPPQIITTTADDLSHHAWAKKYADAYIEDRLRHLSSGESSHDIRNNLI